MCPQLNHECGSKNDQHKHTGSQSKNGDHRERRLTHPSSVQVAVN